MPFFGKKSKGKEEAKKVQKKAEKNFTPASISYQQDGLYHTHIVDAKHARSTPKAKKQVNSYSQRPKTQPKISEANNNVGSNPSPKSPSNFVQQSYTESVKQSKEIAKYTEILEKERENFLNRSSRDDYLLSEEEFEIVEDPSNKQLVDFYLQHRKLQDKGNTLSEECVELLAQVKDTIPPVEKYYNYRKFIENQRSR